MHARCARVRRGNGALCLQVQVPSPISTLMAEEPDQWIAVGGEVIAWRESVAGTVYKAASEYDVGGRPLEARPGQAAGARRRQV